MRVAFARLVAVLAAFLLPLAVFAASPADEKAFVDAYRKAYESKDAKGLSALLYTKGADPKALEFYRMMMSDGMGAKISSIELKALDDEDRKRASYYEDNAKRATLQSSVGSLDDYLASLDMEITFASFDAKGRERIAQLINKSNQFNLTTRRYTEAEVAAFEADPALLTLQVRLADKFGDNGMISVIIGRPAADGALEIDTWLMSCRVLGRRVEQMALRELLAQARARGATRLTGRYIPTPRNGMVKDHYEKLGFTKIGVEAEDTLWSLDVAHEVAAPPMRVVRIGLRDAEMQAAE